jgi:hypothetical protein
MVIYLITTLISFTSIEKIDTSDHYQSAYYYVTENSDARNKIILAFKGVLKKREIKQWTFCIDSFAYALTITGFNMIKDQALRSQIRKIDYGTVPINVTNKSKCECLDTPFNMTFSVLNGNFLTVEVSARKLNPLGGSAFGPSLKFLFENFDDGSIKTVLSQNYTNG